MDSDMRTCWNHGDIKASQCQDAPLETHETTDQIHVALQDDVDGEKRIREAIEEAASRHLDLLNEIQRTQHVVYVQQNNNYTMKYLAEELEKQSKLVKEMVLTTDNEFEKCRKARSEVSKRSIFKTYGPDQGLHRSMEAERAYHNALVARARAEQRKKDLQQDVINVEQENERMSNDLERNKVAQHYIDQLYLEIFEGKTPGFPAEDEREEHFQKQQDEYSVTSATYNAIYNAAQVLSTFTRGLRRIKRYGDQTKVELEKTHRFSGLSYAAVLLEQIAYAIDTIEKEIHEIIAQLPQPLTLETANGHERLVQHLTSASSAAMTAIKGRYNLHSLDAGMKAVQVVAGEMLLAIEVHSELSRSLKSQENTAKSAVDLTWRSMQDAKKALAEIRQNIFEDVVGHGISPPPYHKHCNGKNEIRSWESHPHIRFSDLMAYEASLPPPPNYDGVLKNSDELS